MINLNVLYLQINQKKNLNCIKMSSKYTEIINNLQKKAENIRNICILAHVDHGKLNLVTKTLILF